MEKYAYIPFIGYISTRLMHDESEKFILGTPKKLEQELERRNARMLETNEIDPLFKYLKTNLRNPYCNELYQDMMKEWPVADDDFPSGELIKFNQQKYIAIIHPDEWKECQNLGTALDIDYEGITTLCDPIEIVLNYMGARKVLI